MPSFALSGLVLLASAYVASAAKSVSIKASAPSISANVDELDITTTIVNTGNEELKLLTDPRTALSSWATNTFVVSSASGAVPAFKGVEVRYIPSVAAKSTRGSSFTILAPGASVDIAHEVGRYYNFTNSGVGAYTFKPLSTLNIVNADGSLSTIEATVEAAEVKLTEKLASVKSLKSSSIGGSTPLSRQSKRATYESNCSASRQTQNNAAITAGATLATRSYNHLVANPSGSTLQTTWFGTFSSTRYSKLVTAFQRLKTYPAGWKYDCSCTDSGTYAYVYPSQYGEVYLCGYYWNAPATGSGSRADTIVHEGSHFTQVQGTQDYTYGESSCKSLAKSNPANAANNADNLAFFSDYA